MKGWTGKILRINLSSQEYGDEYFNEEFARKWVGGRGFAVKLLWDELAPGIDPLGPENKLIVALGPIAGIPLPNTGKTVLAAKSPLTGGYGDGNLGTWVTVHLRKAGYDVLIIEGKSEQPVYLNIHDDKVEFLPAGDIWGKGTYATQEWLTEKHGQTSGILSIGQAGENLVRYAVVRSLEGRSGGRPGMGAVMGSKKLKAIVVRGTGKMPSSDPQAIKVSGATGLRQVREMDQKSGWSKQGTTGVLAWCNEVAALPVRNMRKTSHPDAWKIDGERLDEARVATYGCPNCSMHCGIAIHDREGRESELDYENIGMLGSNLEIFNLADVGSLNYLCDDYGLDTISAGSVLGFYADAIERGVVSGEFRFGDSDKARDLLGKISYRDGEGDLLAEGTRRMAQTYGHGAEDYAMHVKGLEISAYNCKFIPGMALAFATSPIGAHHKDAWVIMYEITQTSRESYGPEKAEKVIELQRIRGGLFEFITACRFPWVELGWDLENYATYFSQATGLKWGLDDFWEVGDRIYSMIRAFWVREFPDWGRSMDYPPAIWFDKDNSDKDGPIAGKILNREEYDLLLDSYYDMRGWDHRGIPRKKTLSVLGLDEEAADLVRYIDIAP